MISPHHSIDSTYQAVEAFGNFSHTPDIGSEQSCTSTNSIILMDNFNPLEWDHVHVNLDKIKELATELMLNNRLEKADWTDIVPRGLEMKEQVEYLVGLISIDFCHWGSKLNQNESGIRDFYAKDESGDNVRGSGAMIALARKAYNNGAKIFDAAFMEKATVNDLRPYFMGFDIEESPMEIPWLEDRVRVLNEVGDILLKKWQGSFYNVLLQSEARAFNEGKGFVELLVRDFPRFRDEYIYRDKKIGIYKLPQLAVIALQSALSSSSGFTHFKDCDALTLCADYQLPRSLRAFRVLEYSSELKTYVDGEKWIDSGSNLEIELRMATVFAGHQLKENINALLAEEGRSLITSQELDFALWSHGRKLDRKSSKHHLTRTIMY